jgi:hypothetical protein
MVAERAVGAGRPCYLCIADLDRHPFALLLPAFSEFPVEEELERLDRYARTAPG